MKKLLDQIIVVDVESTSWEGENPDGQVNEIIEIGVCPLEISSGKRLGKESLLVRPEHSTVSEFCRELTTLTQDQVERGIRFPEACVLLQEKYLTRRRTWASYGDYDRRQFEKQCRLYGIAYPFGPSHINVKNLFAIIHKLPEEVGMAEALRLTNVPLEGTHHRGGDDAWNIARILSELIIRNSEADNPPATQP